MDEIKYKHLWNEIDERFNKWFNGGDSWESQVDFLSVEMKKSFKLNGEELKRVFKTFHEVYREDRTISFNWKDYQFPTLVAITANYVKFKK